MRNLNVGARFIAPFSVLNQIREYKMLCQVPLFFSLFLSFLCASVPLWGFFAFHQITITKHFSGVGKQYSTLFIHHALWYNSIVSRGRCLGWSPKGGMPFDCIWSFNSSVNSRNTCCYNNVKYKQKISRPLEGRLIFIIYLLWAKPFIAKRLTHERAFARPLFCYINNIALC